MQENENLTQQQIMPVMREQRALQRLNGPRSVQCYDTVGSQGCHAEYQVDFGDE